MQEPGYHATSWLPHTAGTDNGRSTERAVSPDTPRFAGPARSWARPRAPEVVGAFNRRVGEHRVTVGVEVHTPAVSQAGTRRRCRHPRCRWCRHQGPRPPSRWNHRHSRRPHGRRVRLPGIGRTELDLLTPGAAAPREHVDATRPVAAGCVLARNADDRRRPIRTQADRCARFVNWTPKARIRARIWALANLRTFEYLLSQGG